LLHKYCSEDRLDEGAGGAPASFVQRPKGRITENLMRIERIDLYRVAMPLLSPWRTAYGDDAVIESVLVRMTSDGEGGRGEGSPPRWGPRLTARSGPAAYFRSAATGWRRLSSGRK